MRSFIVAVVVALLTVSLGPTAPARAAELPEWLSYARDAEYDSIASKGIGVVTRDGSELNCDLYRPGRDGAPVEGRFPGVVWQYHGYGVNRTGRDATVAEGLTQRGYVTLQCSVRGTGGSPGPWDPFSARETEDGYDIVEWLAAQEFSTGRVGMVGYSYGAITAMLVAAMRPPHLVTIVPQSSYADAYTDIIRLGGIRTADVRGWVLGLVLALNAAGTPPQQQLALEARAREVDAEWEAHPLHDDYWDARAVDHAAIAAADIPVLGFGGWYDIYQRGMPLNAAALGDRMWLVMEPNAHIGGSYFGTMDRGTLAWLDHHVAQLPEAPLPSARITSYEMPREGGEGWTELSAWPPPDAVTHRMGWTAEGTLADEGGPAGTVSYRVDPADGMPTYWNTGTRPDDPAVRSHHTAREQQRLHAATEPLEADLVVAGTPRLRVRATFDTNEGYLVARVTDVAPDGTTTLVSTGWLLASHRDGHEAAAEVVPGEAADYEIEIWPTHWRFRQGHRLQVSLSSGDVPRTHPDAPQGTVTVDVGEGGAHLDLPVLGETPVGVPVEVPDVRRLRGPSRVDTAVAVSGEAFERADVAVVATAGDFADALAGAPLAAKLDAPLLLTPRDDLAPVVEQELRRLGAREVVLLGGTAALSRQVEDDVSAAGITVRRVSGADRFATAAQIAGELSADGAPAGAILALGARDDGGDAWVDALAAGVLAARTGAAILLARPDALPPATAEALGQLPPGAPVTIAGGPAAVGASVEEAVRSRGHDVRRIAGADRYATAVALADAALEAGVGLDTVMLASGRSFADALAAGPAAHRLGGVLALVDPGDLGASAATHDWLAAHAGEIHHVFIAGGPAAVSEEVAAQIRDRTAPR